MWLGYDPRMNWSTFGYSLDSGSESVCMFFQQNLKSCQWIWTKCGMWVGPDQSLIEEPFAESRSGLTVLIQNSFEEWFWPSQVKKLCWDLDVICHLALVKPKNELINFCYCPDLDQFSNLDVTGCKMNGFSWNVICVLALAPKTNMGRTVMTLSTHSKIHPVMYFRCALLGWVCQIVCRNPHPTFFLTCYHPMGCRKPLTLSRPYCMPFPGYVNNHFIPVHKLGGLP